MPRSLSEPLHRLVHAYKSELRRTIREHELPLPGTHIRALKGVCRNPQCTAQSIAERMRRDKAQITRVLKDLLEKGLIIRVSNPDDRRSQLLRPTDQGLAIMAQLNDLEAQVTEQMTRDMDEDEVESFIQLAYRMADNLSQAEAPCRHREAHDPGENNHGQT